MAANRYMHLLDGKPAYFDGRRLVFARKAVGVARLAYSLKQIRQEQEFDKIECRNRYYVQWQRSYLLIKF